MARADELKKEADKYAEQSVVGVISVKVAIIVPVALIIGAFLGIWLFFSNWWK